ncbi:MAG TPA: hypothetical protein VK762_25135 [Polyangiaceae bacterium]|jgi:hypothetical protein|nr:hypothetical protein [Polyangiaceae bacterium]
MRTEKDVEAYLLRSNRRYRAVDSPEGEKRTFFVDSGAGKPPVAVLVDPPLVVLRVHIGDLAAAGGPTETALFRQLLEFNARQLVHASYGLEDRHVVLSSALELENLDFNEIQATLDEIDVALAQQLSLLAETAKGGLKTNLG